MDERQYYLSKIAEEALEVASAAMKCIQFGNDSRDPSNPDGPTNEEHLLYELYDLLGAKLAAVNRDIIKEDSPDYVWELIKNKRDKIEKYKEICIELGTVKIVGGW